jgi:eukaryotic-like serine/threonine-protein kinase
MVAGKYEYERRLGGGGMAEVFLGRIRGTEGFQRPVAIKRVLPSFSQDPQFAAMFINEARISAMLRHPNIVQILDFDRDEDGRLFLVMELVEGKDLDAVGKAGRLPVPVVVWIISEVLEGLAHAHEMTTPDGRPLGLVHRDISPHNVLVSWDGGVKVSDFGIAKAMLASGVSQSGMIKGKPLYMAPEQVIDPARVDHRADLFAVGVMFYELLTGRRVYQGTTQEEILTDVIQLARGWRPLVAPNLVRPDLPWDVCQVAVTLLAADREQRFSTAREALDALLHTTTAPTRGAQMLSQVLAERFAADAPRRVMTPQQRAAAPTVVPDALRPGPSQVRAQMAAETRTIEPVVGTPPVTPPVRTPSVSPTGPTEAARPPRPIHRAGAGPVTKESGARSSIGPGVIIGLAVAAAISAVAVTLALIRGGGGDAAPPAVDAAAPAAVDAAAPVDAAAAAVDARVDRIAPDASVRVTVPPDAPPPDAPPPGPDAARRPSRRDAGTSVTPNGKPCDHKCDYNCDGIPDCR